VTGGESSDPRPGDTIILARTDGRFDVLYINDDGDRDAIRLGLDDTHRAYIVAVRCLEQSGGVTVWFCHQARPDELQRYG